MSAVIVAVLIMGFSGTVAQILLLREFLITFYGNELSIGIILANWLILEAAGSFFLGKQIEKFRNKVAVFVWANLLFSVFFPATVYLIRIWKTLMGLIPGEAAGLSTIFLASLILLMPVSLTHGALFTYSCKLFSFYTTEDARSIGRVYFYETLGTIAGGVLFTYLLVRYLHSVEIAIAVSLVNILICLYLAFVRHPTARPSRSMYAAMASMFFLVLASYMILGPGADMLHWMSAKKQWEPQALVHYENSVYGNVAVTKEAEQYTFFSDGVPVISIPHPDVVFIEEFVNLPMLFHPGPKEVLIISGGAGGTIKELLKHQVERIDYVELDPLILEVVKKYSSGQVWEELSDPRVKIHLMDGRLFVKRARQRFDLVLVGVSSPQDLQTNRLFTTEFFTLVKKRLKEQGILAFTLPGSLTYLSRELREINSCILNTLKSVFPHVKVIPGEGNNLFLASGTLDLSAINTSELAARMKERGLDLKLLSPEHIDYRLDPRWSAWFLGSLEGGSREVNKDFRPIAVFYSQALWNALFSPRIQRCFALFERMSISHVFVTLATLALLFLVVHLTLINLSRASIAIAVISTGFAGMIYDLVIIFAFQSLYGFVFHWIGPLIAAFMAGVALGSMGVTSRLPRLRSPLGLLIKIELAMVGYSVLLPLVFYLMRPYMDREAVFVLFQGVFVALSVLSGVLIGAEFPLANMIHLSGVNSGGDRRADLSKTAGLLYACDLVGGWFSGILAGVVLLPVLGLMETCLSVVGIKAFSLFLLLAFGKRIIQKP